MTNIFIILAGGINKRLHSNVPKPYIKINNKQLIQYSIDAAKEVNSIKKIVIVHNKGHSNFIKNKIFNNYIKVVGGKSRAESTYNALKKIKKYKCQNVLIHDAARPNLSSKLIKKVIKELKKK